MYMSHIDPELAAQLDGYGFYRVNNDVNGNPRYVIHFLAFASDYDEAFALAKSLGYSKYRGKDFGGGFVTQSYYLDDDARRLIALRNREVEA